MSFVPSVSIRFRFDSIRFDLILVGFVARRGIERSVREGEARWCAVVPLTPPLAGAVRPSVATDVAFLHTYSPVIVPYLCVSLSTRRFFSTYPRALVHSCTRAHVHV